MDSLVANYASSDEEEAQQEDAHIQSEKPNEPSRSTSNFTGNLPSSYSNIPKSSSSILSSLPPPKSLSSSSSSSSSSLFSSLPPPKSKSLNPSQTSTDLSSSKTKIQHQEAAEPAPVKSSSLFSSLPQPQATSTSSLFSSLPQPKPKKVVQVKLPANTSLMKSHNLDDEDDDDDDKEREGRKLESSTQAPSVKSFLSSIPAPKNSSSTLGALPSAAGSGRRSILEANVPSSNSNGFNSETEGGVNSFTGRPSNYEGQWVGDSSSASFGGVSVPSGYAVDVDGGGGGDTSGGVPSGGNYENNDRHAGYGNYDYYGQYNSNWADGSTEMAQSDMFGTDEVVARIPGKRGRNEIPREIVEVKQDELIKNRPREDQVKSTGIAFGPAYQPVSSKGKPSKLHKRKHQIGSLYFDMKQKETELSERRSKGFLTKAETQAKYGW